MRGTVEPAGTQAGVRRWLVVGTAGGVGTTTVTALLFAQAQRRLASVPQLLDHTAGTLAVRSPGADQARTVDRRWTLHDLGRPTAAAIAALNDPSVRVLLVSAATPAGCRLAADIVHDLAGRSDAGPDCGRLELAVVQAYRPARIRAELAELAGLASPAEAGGRVRGPVVLPADRALAAGGPIPVSRLASQTHRAVSTLFDHLLHPV